VPTFNVVSHLVFVTDEQDVASVVVDGKVLMREREMLTIDTARVAAEATALAAKIQAALEDRNRAK
jgi:5-methylthioadenosine/S-adenosylhomocysteine deaminase